MTSAYGAVGAVAALRSVGLQPGVPVRRSRVVLLPHVVDLAAMSTWELRRRRRMDVIVDVRRQLLDDITADSTRQGFDALVDVRFTTRRMELEAPGGMPGTVSEIAAAAVPVRVGRPTGRALFRTALSANDLSALITAGWVAVDVVLAAIQVSRNRRHRQADALAAAGTSNLEIPGPTEIVQGARRQVRDRLAAQGRQLGGDGVLIPDGFELDWSSTRHLIQVIGAGNVIARIRKQGEIVPVPVLPLD